MKNKNIHILPTYSPSFIYEDIKGNLCFNKDWIEIPNGRTNQNIYITSPNEDINENDYIITKDGRLVEVSYIMSKDIEGASKVVLTTDELYIHNPTVPKEYNPSPQYVQKIDDEFLEWFVKNPSCEVVEVEDYGNIYNFRYLILIPKENPKQEPTTCACGANTSCECESEEPKQETLDEAAESYTIDFATWSAFKLGAKWQSERTCKHSYTLTSEQGHRVIKCSKCNDTQPI